MSLLNTILEVFGDRNQSKENNNVVMRTHLLAKTSPTKNTVKKSARILKTSTEHIHALKLSSEDITIHIVPVTADEEAQKRVKGYKYLTL